MIIKIKSKDEIKNITPEKYNFPDGLDLICGREIKNAIKKSDCYLIQLWTEEYHKIDFNHIDEIPGEIYYKLKKRREFLEKEMEELQYAEKALKCFKSGFKSIQNFYNDEWFNVNFKKAEQNGFYIDSAGRYTRRTMEPYNYYDYYTCVLFNNNERIPLPLILNRGDGFQQKIVKNLARCCFDQKLKNYFDKVNRLYSED